MSTGPGVCPIGGETAGPSRLRLVGVYGEVFVGEPAGVADVVGAATERAPVPAVDEIEHEGGVHPDRGVEGGGRLPGPVAHPGHVSTGRAGGVQRDGYAVAGHDVALGGKPVDAHLETLDRRVDVAGGARGAHLLAEHGPRFDGAAKFDGDADDLDRADAREAELEERRQPGCVEVEAVPGEVV